MREARLDWTWTFHLEQTGERETRFLFRVRGNLETLWMRLLYHLAIVHADFVMGRSMCLGLKKRVESTPGAQEAATPSSAIWPNIRPVYSAT